MVNESSCKYILYLRSKNTIQYGIKYTYEKLLNYT